MFNILDTITAGLSDLNTPIGLVGSLVTIFDHFKNKNSNHIEETRDAIRENRAWRMHDTANTSNTGRTI